MEDIKTENKSDLELWIQDLRSNLEITDINEFEKKKVKSTINNLESAIKKRNEFKKPVISVTGTCGKTTTCKMIQDILGSVCTINKTAKNGNSFIGIPYAINKIFSLQSDLWLAEIGIGGPNQMTKLVELVKPYIRIVTNIQVSHTDKNFNSNQYQMEKLKFLTNLPDNTVLILNYDDAILSKLKFNNTIKIIKCGTKSTYDVQLLSHKINDDNISSDIEIKIKNRPIINIRLNSIGYHNALNACLAIGCAYYFDVSNEVISYVLDDFNFYTNRGLIVTTPSYTLYDHTYNCVGYALICNLNSFKNVKCSNKLIILGFYEISEQRLKYYIDFSKKITNNVIIYTNKVLSEDESNRNMSNKLINKYNIYTDYSDMISYIEKSIENHGYISIFIQSCAELLMNNFVEKIKSEL